MKAIDTGVADLGVMMLEAGDSIEVTSGVVYVSVNRHDDAHYTLRVRTDEGSENDG